MMNTMSEWTLLASDQPDRDVMEILYEQHHHFVYRVAMGFVADPDMAQDVTHDVFIRVIKHRRRWKDQARFRTLLYRVTYFVCQEYRRRRLRRQRLRRWIGWWNENRETVTGKASNLQGLMKILQQLPERQRVVLVLRFYEGLSVKETAQIMGCRPGTVKAHLFKAINNLRRMLRIPPEKES